MRMRNKTLNVAGWRDLYYIRKADLLVRYVFTVLCLLTFLDWHLCRKQQTISLNLVLIRIKFRNAERKNLESKATKGNW